MARANYVWEDAARRLSIRLALDVVARLKLESLEAFKAVPRRGLEIGGLLLGKTETHNEVTSISIEGCEAVDSEHRFGPSYRLSEDDRRRLDEAFARHPDAVGIYRTDTGEDGLILHPEDGQLLQGHAKEGPGVFLLVHPVSGQAAFFLSEDGSLAKIHEFPFQPADLAGAVEEEERAQLEAPTYVFHSPEPPTPQMEATRTRWDTPASVSRRWKVWAARVGAVAAGGMLGAFLWNQFAPPRTTTRVVPAMAAAAAPVGVARTTLNVEREGRALRLRWDRNSPAIRQADHAILYISDGNRQSELDLDSRELNSGSLAYWPESGDVAFRLKTFSGDRSTEDVIRAVVAMDPAPLPQVPSAGAPVRAARAPAPAARRPKASPTPTPKPAAEEVTAERTTPDTPKPSPFAPAPETRAEARTPPITPAAAVSGTAADAAATAPPPIPRKTVAPVSMSAEPAGGSRIGRAVGRIPLLRRLRKAPQNYVPAAPQREYRPAISATQRKALTAAVPIDVRVYVTAAGEVEFAELVDTKLTARHSELASAAVFAARRWDFRPAREGEENVPAAMILHFIFNPESETP
jgi:hypothetical protein